MLQRSAGSTRPIILPKMTFYETYNFAIGYEKLDGVDEGSHHNLECIIRQSGTVHDNYAVEAVRGVAMATSRTQLKFNMDVYRSKSYSISEMYAENEPIEIILTPNEAPMLYFEVSSESAVKWTHIEKCEIMALRDDHYVINSMDLINDGCINEQNFDFVWMPDGRRAANFDRFGLKPFELPSANSYAINCYLHACDYYTNSGMCSLSPQCPNKRRYEIFANNRFSRSAEETKSRTKVTRAFKIYRLPTADGPTDYYGDYGARTIGGNISHNVEKISAMDFTKFTMDTYATSSPSEKYPIGQMKTIVLSSSSSKLQSLSFEVSSAGTAAGKWTHIEKCRFLPLRSDASVIEESSFDLVKDGCVAAGVEHFVRMSPRRVGQTFDRFELEIFKLDSAASYMIHCNLHACDYFTNGETCHLSSTCNDPKRYESIERLQNAYKILTKSGFKIWL